MISLFDKQIARVDKQGVEKQRLRRAKTPIVYLEFRNKCFTFVLSSSLL